MDCTQSALPGNDDYLRRLDAQVEAQRVPVSGAMDLTHRCNLRCGHCYLSEADRAGGSNREELSTDRWLRILDAVTEAGCLFLLLSGGEPLLRSDFGVIYRYARHKGMLVSVFTNGTRMREPILDLFQDLPPRKVEVSLYGATAPTYERVTGVPGSFRRCMDGIEALLARRIPVDLKTLLMTVNRHELAAMRRIAVSLGVGFRFDAALFPRLNGDRHPLKWRVPPEEAIAVELADKNVLGQWRSFYRSMCHVRIPEALYHCGAGHTTFHIDPAGELTPCLMADSPRYCLAGGTFAEGWKQMADLDAREALREFPCCRCAQRILCDYCPGLFRLETGAEDIASGYICAMGGLRYARITQMTRGEGHEAG